MANTQAKWSEVELIKRNPNAEHHCDIMGLGDLRITKPTLICLSGNGAVNLQDANGFAKQAETYLELLFKESDGNGHITDHVDLIGVKYSRTKEDETAGNMQNSEVMKFVDLTLAPLFVDSKGQRLSIESACKNMSQVNFFTYCAGDEILSRIFNYLDHRLEQFGYSNDEVQQINSSTMNVSFAPFNYLYNPVPSVRVISAKDDTVAEDLEYMMSKEEASEFDGLELKYDEPGKLYGVLREFAMAGSIDIISGQMLNGILTYEDEHNVGLLARDGEWNLKGRRDEKRSPNADCVSQMLAWALSRAVQNSIDNYHSKKYISNNFYTDLMTELQSIRATFSEQELSANSEYKKTERMKKFETLRKAEIAKRAKQMKDFKPELAIVRQELENAKTFSNIYVMCEKFNYHYVDEILGSVDFLNKSEEQIIRTIASEKAKEQQKEKIGKATYMDVFAEMMKAKSLDEFRTIVEKYDGKYMSDLMPDFLHNIPANEKQYDLKPEEAKIIMSEFTEKKNQEKAFLERPFHERLLYELNNQTDFEGIVRVFNKYGFEYAADFIPSIQGVTLFSEQRTALMAAGRAKWHVDEAKQKLVKFDTYEQMIETINGADSVEEIKDYLRKHNSVGVEYLMQEDLVLTDAERKEILDESKAMTPTKDDFLP